MDLTYPYTQTRYHQLFCPDLTDGVRFDDPAFGIAWPHPVTNILERDRCYPDFDLVRHTNRYNATSQDRRAS